MSDERRPSPEPKPHAAAEVDNHWCMHEGCRRWGSFGFVERYGTVWYCGEHRPAKG